MFLFPTPIEPIRLFDKTIFIKRDDLIHKDFSGNKARKLLYFLEDKQEEFTSIQHLVSYGSNQSNAMYSLSVLAQLKGWKFTYLTHHIPSYLKENPQGNYLYALQNGMNIFESNNIESDLELLLTQENILYIPEGGYCQEAGYGIKKLALEIDAWLEKQTPNKKYRIFLPSGTGTTALYLQKYSQLDVLTVPCVGDSHYLQQELETLEPHLKTYPTILEPKRKYHFGKLYKNLYDTWEEVQTQSSIEFDLLYDPIGLETLREYNLENIIYIHQGGLLGNKTMIERYKHKYANG
jgi:1-aminocyclopropane-1-carboxylate deaminase/D-cysteine desulfhydrase-like pyridoxal-dependent ACC family enzyme